MKNFIEEIKNIDSSRGRIRSFGRLFAFIGIVGGIILFIFSTSGKLPFIFLLIGLIFILTTFIKVEILKPLFLFWMTLAFVLGFIVSNIILVIFYYLILTPISLLGRIFGKNFLDISWQDDRATYWLKRDKKFSKEDYEKQF